MQEDKTFVSIEEWKEICKRIGAWCSFDEVSELTYEQAEYYVKTMPTFCVND